MRLKFRGLVLVFAMLVGCASHPVYRQMKVESVLENVRGRLMSVAEARGSVVIALGSLIHVIGSVKRCMNECHFT